MLVRVLALLVLARVHAIVLVLVLAVVSMLVRVLVYIVVHVLVVCVFVAIPLLLSMPLGSVRRPRLWGWRCARLYKRKGERGLCIRGIHVCSKFSCAKCIA